jgi:hypothetical protein
MVDIGLAEIGVGLADNLGGLLTCEKLVSRLLTEIPLKGDIRIFDPFWE